jgi:putative heme-binding domain-containing protein
LIAIAKKAELNPSLWRELISQLNENTQVAEGDLHWLEQAAPAEFQPRIRQLRIQRNSEADAAAVTELAPLLQGGDPNRGHELFLGKAVCTGCHRVGKQGGRVGPDLTKIGAIRSGRDLLEAIVMPSAAFSQGYESYKVTLKSGEDFIGVRVRDADAALLFRDGSGGETRFNENEIETIEPTKVSLMPEGLLSGLSQEETRDLLAYLQSLR